MKPQFSIYPARIAFLIAAMAFFGCQSDPEPGPYPDATPDQELADPNATDPNANDDQAAPVEDLTDPDHAALYFMLEEEKLARDVYNYLGALWNHPTFANIEKSEISHIGAVIALLETYGLEYELAEAGTFLNADLQQLYNTLVADGSADLAAGLRVGARIEDLDIRDLEDYLVATSNPLLVDVFSSLQCGSRNHLRAFTASLDALGESYEPEFISPEAYLDILEGTRETCN